MDIEKMIEFVEILKRGMELISFKNEKSELDFKVPKLSLIIDFLSLFSTI